ncbi:cytochrome P450 1A5-like isoform X1 [Haliotis rufescens]|uniref:cytochrome P450 1A5-like isoform X1 n=1 Tax=Haliotis rufescens TaxID=6454 RepID=UPI00201F5DF3|nr:cytochrome P450 1A5-like isoform X1 [Haliotis rufescens]XP_048253123.1 cytochrome P450 1A5-like isoform X1 [Haliotis rufescens]
MMEGVMQLWPKSVVSLALVVGGVIGLVGFYLFKKLPNFPPGPKRWSLIGTIAELRGGLFFRFIRDWSKKYGPVMLVHIDYQEIIVLSRIDVVREALITRQADFEGRPDAFAAHTLSEGGKRIIHSPYGPTWKIHRKIASKALRQYLMGDHLSWIVSKSLNIMTKQMRKERKAFNPFYCISLGVSNMMTGMLFDKISQTEDSENYKTYVDNFDTICFYGGGSFFEDLIPLLHLCPLPRLYRAQGYATDMADAIRTEIAAHRDTFDKNKMRDFTDALILAQKEVEVEDDPTLTSQITDTHLVQAIFNLVLAGTNTTRDTLNWCILAMALYPDIQTKVQDEVDTVVGPDLNVHVSDRDRLPYTDAVIHEVMRMRTETPMGVPHVTLRRTTIGGYDVFEGSLVYINYTALHFDPDQWEDVNTFKPERFLDSEGKMGPTPESWFPFSAGRRVCLDASIAIPELPLVLAGILRAFTISLGPGTQHDFEPKDLDDSNTPGRYLIVAQSRI